MLIVLALSTMSEYLQFVVPYHHRFVNVGEVPKMVMCRGSRCSIHIQSLISKPHGALTRSTLVPPIVPDRVRSCSLCLRQPPVDNPATPWCLQDVARCFSSRQLPFSVAGQILIQQWLRFAPAVCVVCSGSWALPVPRLHFGARTACSSCSHGGRLVVPPDTNLNIDKKNQRNSAVNSSLRRLSMLLHTVADARNDVDCYIGVQTHVLSAILPYIHVA